MITMGNVSGGTLRIGDPVWGVTTGIGWTTETISYGKLVDSTTVQVFPPQDPPKRETNVEWLNKRIDEMRVRL